VEAQQLLKSIQITHGPGEKDCCHGASFFCEGVTGDRHCMVTNISRRLSLEVQWHRFDGRHGLTVSDLITVYVYNVLRGGPLNRVHVNRYRNLVKPASGAHAVA